MEQSMNLSDSEVKDIINKYWTDEGYNVIKTYVGAYGSTTKVEITDLVKE